MDRRKNNERPEDEDSGEEDPFLERLWPREAARKRESITDIVLRAESEKLLHQVDQGDTVVCPVCEKPAKLQDEGVGRMGAIALVGLVARYLKRGHPINLAFFAPWRTGVATTRFHGLTIPGSVDKPGRVRTGLWTPTEFGIQFVRGVGTIKETVVKYNKKPRGFDGPDVSIRHFLSKFEHDGALECLRDQSGLYDWVSKIAPSLSLPNQTYWEMEELWGVKTEELPKDEERP